MIFVNWIEFEFQLMVLTLYLGIGALKVLAWSHILINVK